MRDNVANTLVGVVSDTHLTDRFVDILELVR